MLVPGNWTRENTTASFGNIIIDLIFIESGFVKLTSCVFVLLPT